MRQVISSARRSSFQEVVVVPVVSVESEKFEELLSSFGNEHFDDASEIEDFKDNAEEVNHRGDCNDVEKQTPRRLRSVEIELNIKPSPEVIPLDKLSTSPTQVNKLALFFNNIFKCIFQTIILNPFSLLVFICTILILIPLMTKCDFYLSNSHLEDTLLKQKLRSIVYSCLAVTIPIWLELIFDLVAYYSIPSFKIDWFELISRVLLQLALIIPMIIVFIGNTQGHGVIFVSLLYLQIIIWAGVILSLLHHYNATAWPLQSICIIQILMTCSYLIDFTFLYYSLFFILPVLAIIIRFICFIIFFYHAILQNNHITNWFSLCKLTHKEYSSLVICITGSISLLCYSVQTFFLPKMMISNCDDMNLIWYFCLLSGFILIATVMPGRSALFESIQLKQNLEMKRTFVRYVSHEVRTPLNTICMGLELVESDLRRARVKPDTIETMGQLKESALVAVETLSDLLLYEKIDSGLMALEMNYYEPSSFLRKACEPFKVQARAKDINLYVIPLSEATTSSIQIDDKKMSQVLRNFVSNAIKFTPRGGTVEIGMSILRDIPSSKLLRIYVKDNGYGISESNQKKVFNEIVQFHANQQQSGGGSGLGLWITKKIVEQHRGTVGVFSAGEGKGSTFFVDLHIHDVKPIVVDEISEQQYIDNRESKRESIVMQRKRSSISILKRLSICEDVTHLPLLNIEEGKIGTYTVLVVDDIELNRKVMVKALRSNGHICLEADDGDVAVQMFSKNSEGSAPAVDVILMDKFMPKMDGNFATKRLRELGFSGFIIGCTGDTEPDTNALFASSGADMVMVKPMKVREFEAAMEDLIASRDLKNAVLNIGKNSRKMPNFKNYIFDGAV